MKKQHMHNAKTSLDLIVHRLLRIVAEGIFEWNGDLFFCPFINIENKKKFSSASWFRESKSRNWSPIYQMNGYVIFAADPVNPAFYEQEDFNKMDRILLIGPTSVVFQKQREILVKNGNKIDRIKFISKLSDNERAILFPKDGYGHAIRQLICDAARGKFTVIAKEEIEQRWQDYIDQNKIAVY